MIGGARKLFKGGLVPTCTQEVQVLDSQHSMVPSTPPRAILYVAPKQTKAVEIVLYYINIYIYVCMHIYE